MSDQDDTERVAVPGAGRGLLAKLGSLRRPRSVSAQRGLLSIAAVGFVAIGVIALANFPDDVERHPRWWLLAVMVLVGPVCTISCNALEYVQQHRLVGSHVSFAAAARISVLGTAANLLPLPGSVLVRTQAIATAGAGYRKAASTTALVGIAWLGATGIIAGPAAISAGAAWLVMISVTLAGLALLGLTYVWVRRLAPPAGAANVFGSIVAVEIATTVVGGLRLFAIIVGLGLDVDTAQALALTLSGALAAATGILPAGLGIREAMTAAIASVVDLPAAVGFVAAAADRLAGLLVVGVIAAVLAAKAPGNDAQTSSPGAHDPTR